MRRASTALVCACFFAATHAARAQAAPPAATKPAAPAAKPVAPAPEPPAAEPPPPAAAPTPVPEVHELGTPPAASPPADAPAAKEAATTEPAATPAPVPPAKNPMAEETFTTLTMPTGEAPPLPFPVVLSLGSMLTPRVGVGDFYLEPHARVRLRAAWSQADPNYYTVGQNNGFNLAQARVGLTGGYKRTVKFSISMEGAADRRTGQNQLTGELSTRLKDANFTFSPWDFLQFTAGQFLPPSDREMLTGIDAATGSNRGGVATPQLLPDVSVANRGVQAGEGLQVRGMAPGRELGMMVHGDIRPVSFAGASYALALVNGNGENQVLNDNSEPTLYGRVTAGIHNLPVLQLANVGASLHYGRNTDLSNLPDAFSDENLGGALDGIVQILGFQVWAEMLWQQARHLTTRSPTELSLGGFVQVAYRDLYGFSPVLRAAYYQASSALPQYNVAELTAGMRYDVPGLPLSVNFAFTHPEETGFGVFDLGAADAKTRNSSIPAAARIPQGVRAPFGVNNWGPDQMDGAPITNDRVEAVFQMSF